MRPAFTFSIAAFAGAAADRRLGAARSGPKPTRAAIIGALAVDRFGVFAYGSSYRLSEPCRRPAARARTNARAAARPAGSSSNSPAAAAPPTIRSTTRTAGPGAGEPPARATRRRAGRKANVSSRSGGAACGNHVWSCNSDDGSAVEMLSVNWRLTRSRRRRSRRGRSSAAWSRHSQMPSATSGAASSGAIQ